MEIVAAPVAIARRSRAFVGVSGPQAGDLLQRLVSNDVAALAPGASCEALFLNARARVLATLVVLRRAPDDFLLLTEPELGERVCEHVLRLRFAARVEVALEEHRSFVLLGTQACPAAGTLAVPTADYGVPAWEVLDAAEPPDAARLGDEELERLRIEAGTPRFGREIDERVLPEEAGLVERAVSFTKGCYPGQEPIARLHYRGHPNRRLRVLRVEGDPPPAETEILHAGGAVGRVTSAVRAGAGAVALGYVRAEVPDDAALVVNGARATMSRSERP